MAAPRILIDPTRIAGVSQLQIGVTLTQIGPDFPRAGSVEARERANVHTKAMRESVFAVHAFEFGGTQNITIGPESAPNWARLDERMSWLREIGAEKIMLIFYSAPEWMLVTGLHPKYKKLDPAYEQAYADLCLSVLERYTSSGWDMPIHYVCFWNELKGYGRWSKDWQITDFTRAYNTWYDTIRARSEFDSIQVVGPYYIIENGGPLIKPEDLAVLDYFYQNTHGVDIIAYDHGLSHGDAPTLPQGEYMRRTREFAAIPMQLQIRYPGHLVASMEQYANSNLWDYASLDVAFQAAFHASVLYHEVRAGVNLSLSWGLQGDYRIPPGGIIRSWLADVRPLAASAGEQIVLPGDKTPLYDVYRIFQAYFGPGEELLYTESSDLLLELLATKHATLLINKRPVAVEVWLNGERISLERYEVRLLLEPEQPSPTVEEIARRVAQEEVRIGIASVRGALERLLSDQDW